MEQLQSAEFEMEIESASAYQELTYIGERSGLTTSQMVYLPFKRFFDIVLSAMALVACAPLFLVVAIAIKLDSPGPVFYSLLEVGKDGRLFRMFKLRSMVSNADEIREQDKSLRAMNIMDGPLFKIVDDPRITRVGRFIRKFSIDELPQFLNVFLGHMSLVGPRPMAAYEVANVDPCMEAALKKRISIMPGITCFWQAYGRSNITSFEQRMAMDIAYISKMGPITDLRILLRTIPAVLVGKGAS